MSRRRVLLLMKPFNVYPPSPRSGIGASTSSSFLPCPPNHKILKYLEDRCRVHKDTIDLCQDVLRRKSIDCESILRNNLRQLIHHVDLVVTVGGDGTLLQASHYLDDSIPVLGVNSDPTQVAEVEEFSDEFDATRSTGYLCAATSGNFEQVLDEILEGHMDPSELTRMSINLNNQSLSTYALNDILVVHPCPATVSRFSSRIESSCGKRSSLMNCRSSGLRVSTAAGSTAAMLSAGGFSMPITSVDLQYMVREPVPPMIIDPPMHGFIKPDQTMHVTWYCKEGTLYIDGSHVFYSVQYGDTVVVSSRAPVLKVYLPLNLLQ